MHYAYYLPAEHKVFGTKDADTIALLYAAYMSNLAPEQMPGRYDGASITDDNVYLTIGGICHVQARR
jgi:hypothetical protein